MTEIAAPARLLEWEDLRFLVSPLLDFRLRAQGGSVRRAAGRVVIVVASSNMHQRLI